MRKTVFTVLAVILLGFTASSDFAQEDTDGILRMELEEMKNLFELDSVVVIDVRSLRDYVRGHIPGALPDAAGRRRKPPL